MMIYNLATDVASGLTGPLQPSYERIPYVVFLIVIILIADIVVRIVNLRRSRTNKADDKQKEITSFADLSEEEKELIRKHREENKNKKN